MSARASAVIQRAKTTLQTSTLQIQQNNAVTSKVKLPKGVDLSIQPSSQSTVTFQPDGSVSPSLVLCLGNTRDNKAYKIDV